VAAYPLASPETLEPTAAREQHSDLSLVFTLTSRRSPLTHSHSHSRILSLSQAASLSDVQRPLGERVVRPFCIVFIVSDCISALRFKIGCSSRLLVYSGRGTITVSFPIWIIASQSFSCIKFGAQLLTTLRLNDHLLRPFHCERSKTATDDMWALWGAPRMKCQRLCILCIFEEIDCGANLQASERMDEQVEHRTSDSCLYDAYPKKQHPVLTVPNSDLNIPSLITGITSLE